MQSKFGSHFHVEPLWGMRIVAIFTPGQANGWNGHVWVQTQEMFEAGQEPAPIAVADGPAVSDTLTLTGNGVKHSFEKIKLRNVHEAETRREYVRTCTFQYDRNVKTLPVKLSIGKRRQPRQGGLGDKRRFSLAQTAENLLASETLRSPGADTVRRFSSLATPHNSWLAHLIAQLNQAPPDGELIHPFKFDVGGKAIAIDGQNLTRVLMEQAWGTMLQCEPPSLGRIIHDVATPAQLQVDPPTFSPKTLLDHEARWAFDPPADSDIVETCTFILHEPAQEGAAAPQAGRAH